MTLIDDAIHAFESDIVTAGAEEVFKTLRENSNVARVTAAIIQAQALDRLTAALKGAGPPEVIEVGEIKSWRGGLYASPLGLDPNQRYISRCELNGTKIEATGATVQDVHRDLAKKVADFLLPSFTRE